MQKRLSEELPHIKIVKKHKENLGGPPTNYEEIIARQQAEIHNLKSDLSKEKRETKIITEALQEINKGYKELYQQNRDFLIDSFNKISKITKIPEKTVVIKNTIPLVDSSTSPLKSNIFEIGQIPISKRTRKQCKNPKK